MRRATRDDVVTRLKHQQREQEAHRICLLKIRERGLGDEADARRAAVRRLAADLLLHGRRRASISASWCASSRRSSARASRCGRSASATRRKMLGGYGTCGRPLCCTTFLQTFEPVSIKMAKQQDLSLNPSKLSGMCGRLKCCLRYELPNAKGVKHGGCADEGGCAQQPDRPGATAAAVRATRRLRDVRVRSARPTHRHHRRRSRRHRAGDRAQGGRPIRASWRVCEHRALRPHQPDEIAPFRPRPRLGRRPGAPPTTRSSRAVADARDGRIDAIATAPINKEAFAAGRPAVERPHRSARASDRRAARRDDVLLRGAARRAGDGAHPARRGAARADARARSKRRSR